MRGTALIATFHRSILRLYVERFSLKVLSVELPIRPLELGMTAIGTKLPIRDVRASVAIGGKADLKPAWRPGWALVLTPAVLGLARLAAPCRN